MYYVYIQRKGVLFFLVAKQKVCVGEKETLKRNTLLTSRFMHFFTFFLRLYFIHRVGFIIVVSSLICKFTKSVQSKTIQRLTLPI